MRRALLTSLLLAPSLAFGDIVITETGDKPDEQINIAECRGDQGAESKIALAWSVSNTTFTEVEVRVSDTSGCPTSTSNSTAHTSSFGKFNANQTVVSTSSPDILSRIGIPSSECGTGANVTVNVCVVLLNNLGNEISGATMTDSILFDRTIPATPNAPTVAPGDAALHVSWEAVSGSRLSYRVEATPTDTPGGPPAKSEEVRDTSIRLSGLDVGREYSVVLIAISEAGNESARSAPTLGTPVVVNDFWDLYRRGGGADEGGCSTTGAGALAMVALVPLALRRRRK